MTDENLNALIFTPTVSLQKADHGPGRILSGMVSDALAFANRQGGYVLHRIGEYEFRDPDYEQILIWANALLLTPEVVLDHLAGSTAKFPDISFRVQDGRIFSLLWDFNLLPISKFDWLGGLCIESMGFKGGNTSDFSIKIVTLRVLSVNAIGLTELDLSSVPNLDRLCCDMNQLTELNLSSVPNLDFLSCESNQLTELDLSSVPNLDWLSCGMNQLTELDLSSVPNLAWFYCSSNQFTELDVSCVPDLLDLICSFNQLSELDLSNVSELDRLICCSNRLTQLDLSWVPNLTELGCSNNQLTQLGLSCVPELKTLFCSSNQLTELDLQANRNLVDPLYDIDEVVLKNATNK